MEKVTVRNVSADGHYAFAFSEREENIFIHGRLMKDAGLFAFQPDQILFIEKEWGPKGWRATP